MEKQQHTPTPWIALYWIRAAREQNRWRIQLRHEARSTRRCRASGRLFDESLRCRERRDVFMTEARTALAKAGAWDEVAD